MGRWRDLIEAKRNRRRGLWTLCNDNDKGMLCGVEPDPSHRRTCCASTQGRDSRAGIEKGGRGLRRSKDARMGRGEVMCRMV